MLENLIAKEIITIGENSDGNPKDVSKGLTFAIGIANKDYPAKTPKLWNTVYDKYAQQTRNIRMFGNPDDAKEIFECFKTDERYIGGDVGVGFKNQILYLLDEVDPLAKVMGAVNVVVKTKQGLKGYNTDGEGYVQSLKNALLKQGKQLENTKILLLGAGGTTSAIAFALAQHKAELIILNRTVEKAQTISDKINAYFGAYRAKAASRLAIATCLPYVDAVVSIIDDPSSPIERLNALGPITFPITPDVINKNRTAARILLNKASKNLIVSDVMLRQTDTATIAQAKELGFPTLDGLPMVINQAIEAFWLVNRGIFSQNGITKDNIAQLMRF